MSELTDALNLDRARNDLLNAIRLVEKARVALMFCNDFKKEQTKLCEIHNDLEEIEITVHDLCLSRLDELINW